MYNAVTRHISVTVTPYFIEEQSDPEDNHFVWAYQVNIENQGRETVQLKSRYWHITDANGQIHEVRGDGVVGEQPVLRPGESFEYTSGAPLSTPSGIMAGRYQMETNGGEGFEIDIPAFSLDSPYQRTSLN
ncbi:MAG: Co2+/Mg2+ efflux protein ApaG [Alphaproteobacteria bacterium]|nr:Co2+/Mg2+ efflux protein ApaG [Alphaproteobacteria bacterium]